MAEPALPLAGLRVLDLTIFLSGPFGTQILGDLGAEIVKLESPEGDPTRHLPPYFVGEDSAYYLSINRNKRSIALDLKQAEGRALARRLALSCDVVVENFRPGVIDRLGLSYEDLAAEKPGLIWCSISGFGQDGPYRDRPAYDMIVQALSGGMSMTGEPDGPPVRAGIPIGDLAAGMYGVIGVLAAVAERNATGRGRRVDISMLDCQMAMLCYQASYHLQAGVVPGRQGRGHDSIPTYRGFTAGDGRDLVITANTERMWLALCQVLDLPDLPGDPRYVTNAERHRNRASLLPVLEAAFLARPAEEWGRLLTEAGIANGVVNTLDRSLADPQVLHRNMVLDLADAAGHRARVAGNPIKFAAVPDAAAVYPPALGADGEEILRGLLGLDADEIAALRAGGVVRAGKA
jgi:CoA:oxalate CoA-transferase